MTTIDLDKLRKTVTGWDSTPEDRAIYADALEEAGDERAAFWRWAVREELAPDDDRGGLQTYRNFCSWGIESERHLTGTHQTKPCFLPDSLWHRTKVEKIEEQNDPYTWIFFPSPEEAWNEAEKYWTPADATQVVEDGEGDEIRENRKKFGVA